MHDGVFKLGSTHVSVTPFPLPSATVPVVAAATLYMQPSGSDDLVTAFAAMAVAAAAPGPPSTTPIKRRLEFGAPSDDASATPSAAPPSTSANATPLSAHRPSDSALAGDAPPSAPSLIDVAVLLARSTLRNRCLVAGSTCVLRLRGIARVFTVLPSESASQLSSAGAPFTVGDATVITVSFAGLPPGQVAVPTIPSTLPAAAAAGVAASPAPMATLANDAAPTLPSTASTSTATAATGSLQSVARPGVYDVEGMSLGGLRAEVEAIMKIIHLPLFAPEVFTAVGLQPYR